MIGRAGIPFLVAVIVGIILLAVVIFFVYEALKRGTWDCVKCKTQFTTWCLTCYRANVGMDVWSGGDQLGDDLYECVKNCGYWPSVSGANQRCENAKDPCDPFILYTE